MINSPPAAEQEALTHARVGPTARLILLGVAALVVLLSLLRIVIFWRNQAYLHPQAGVWLALAYDTANGAFYRSLDGPLGYGGTRYFPLPFVLDALVMKITGQPIWSGYILSFAWVSLLVGGIYTLLRRVNLPPVLAGSAAAFTLASQIIQDALLSPRGDTLATTLGIWGAAICIPLSAAASSLFVAAALFTLAFASKATAVGPLLAVVLGLALARRWRTAITLCVATGVGFGLVLLAMYFFSDGRAFEALRSGGGSTTIRSIVLSPLTMARLARQEPETLVFIALGFAALLSANLGRWKLPDFPTVLMLSIAVVTSGVFSFEGTDTNHLIDLFVASVIMIAIAAGRELQQDQGTRFSFAMSSLVVATLAASLSLVSGVINQNTEDRWGTQAESLAYVKDPSRPILAENPILSVARNEQPYVLDPYMFRLMRERDPQYGSPLWDKLRNQEFSAVILDRDPHSDRGVEWYLAFFGKGFIEEMEQHYAEAARVRSRIIYLPKN